jgi:hypothetical protein
LDSEIEASIQASFNTVLPYILFGNKRETTGGACECLIGYIKDFTIWHPRGAQGYSGLGTKHGTGRLKKLRSTLILDPKLNKMAVYLSTDSAAFISEYLEFFTSQYEEYVDTSTFQPVQALNTVLDLSALIFKELHSARAEVMDAGQHDPGIFLWGFIKAWEIQEHCRRKKIKDDSALTGSLVHRMLVHDGEKSLKEQLAMLTKHEDALASLRSKMIERHQEVISYQNKVKSSCC